MPTFSKFVDKTQMLSNYKGIDGSERGSLGCYGNIGQRPNYLQGGPAQIQHRPSLQWVLFNFEVTLVGRVDSGEKEEPVTPFNSSQSSAR